jgi:hypothetical protein
MPLTCEQIIQVQFMKTKIKTFLALIGLSLLATGPLWAQAEAETNKPSTASAREPAAANPGEEHESVRIDHTGVHVGGADPVDINVPNWGPQLGPLIPIISILAVFGMPVAIVGIILFVRHRRNRMLHETIRAMVEKGVPIPPELISGGGAALGSTPPPARRGDNDLRGGLILIAVGVGVMMIAGKWGAIPLLIGVAMIVAWLIGHKTRTNQPPQ